MGAGAAADGAAVQRDPQACARLLLLAAASDGVEAGEGPGAPAPAEREAGGGPDAPPERGEAAVLEVAAAGAAQSARDVQALALHCAQRLECPAGRRGNWRWQVVGCSGQTF